MDKVHRIPEPRAGGHRQRDARDGRGFLPRPAAQRALFLPIDPLNLLVIYPPAFPSQPHVDPGAAVASLGLSDPSYPRPEPLIADFGIAACSDPARLTDTPVADSAQRVPPATWRQFVSPWALPVFAVIVFSAWMSSACSATLYFNRRFFVFQMAQFLHVADFRRIRDPVLPAQVLEFSGGMPQSTRSPHTNREVTGDAPHQRAWAAGFFARTSCKIA